MSELVTFFKEKIGHSADAKFQTIEADNQQIEFIYLASVCDGTSMQKSLLVPFYTIASTANFIEYVKSLESYAPYTNKEETLDSLLRGFVLILIGEEALLVGCRNSLMRQPLDTSVETTIQGPQKALSEDATTNISLIRHRYHQPSLTVEFPPTIGVVDRMQLVLLYDRERAKPELIEEVKKKLTKIDKEIIQSTGELHRELTGGRKLLFPIYMITERPDRIAYNLSKGKVILIIEGNPFALIAPAVFFDFMSSMEDMYQPYWVGKFLITLRYIGLFLSLILPSAYVGVTSYNPELFRVQLALSIAGSRAAVPYPSYLEVVFMLFMMELLVEASIRLPKTIGSTATTVGGLILGQAAVEAALVSNIMIIIVASVAISNFVIPINEMGFAMRVVKYILLALTTVTGLVGLIVGLLSLIIYLVSIKSFQEPYLRITYGEKPEQLQ